MNTFEWPAEDRPPLSDPKMRGKMHKLRRPSPIFGKGCGALRDLCLVNVMLVFEIRWGLEGIRGIGVGSNRWSGVFVSLRPEVRLINEPSEAYFAQSHIWANLGQRNIGSNVRPVYICLHASRVNR